MAQNETAHLVSMAGDITANLAVHADAEERIADHLQRFWAPRMRVLLLEYAHLHPDELPALLRAALGKLQA